MFDSTKACSLIAFEIGRFLLTHRPPILVALDGGSGAGKSSLSVMLWHQLDAVVVQLDDFFAANIPDWEWDTFSIPERARLVFDWHRLRKEALEPLRASAIARWHPFDFTAGLRPDGTCALSPQTIEKQPAPVIILEGAYSASPEIADLVDLAVLIDVPVHERHKRIDGREADKEFVRRWHARWDAVEAHYFVDIRPRSSFDIVIGEAALDRTNQRCKPDGATSLA